MSALAAVTRPTDGDTDDRDLVARVRAGDDRAFESLFQRYQPRIAAYVRGMVHDHGRAEDITQEVFMSALRRMRDETAREIHFKPWIFEIAKNKCIDAFRRTRSASEVSFDARDAIGADEHGRLAEPGATPDSAVEGKVAIDNLFGAFGGLSAVHHDILVLRELEGLSYREIGDRLGMSRAAVESTLFRARKRLSAEYEEIVSGERCLRVQRIVDASDGRAAGLRDRRRMARHLAHCQPCRRYAARTGVDLGTLTRPAAAAARIAAFLPLPAFLRRRWGSEDATPWIAHSGPVSHWSANLAGVVDPGIVSGWTKAVATAATVAVAGMSAGSVMTDRPALITHAAPPAQFAQAPGHASSRAHDAGAAAGGTAAAKHSAAGALVTRSTRPARPAVERAGASGQRPGAPPASPADTSPQPGRQPSRPQPDASAGPVAAAGAVLGGKRRDRRASAARAVGRVLAAVAGSRHAPRPGAGAAGAPAADVAVLLKGLAAPVAGAVGTVEQELRTSAEATAGRHRSDRPGR
jgi:RNA polymerase sigma factor (sigma-70 family)